MPTTRTPSRFLLPAIVILALALIATAVWLVADGSRNRSDGTAQSTEEPSAGTGGPESAAAAPTETQTEPDLSDVQWTYDSGRVFPFSQSAGPLEWAEGQPATGFAHTPDGALIASFHITSRTGPTFPLETRLSTIDEQVADSPGRDTFRAATEESADEPFEEPDEPAVVAGYLIHAYSDSSATVEIAMAQGDLLAAFILVVEWDEEQEDWRLLPPGNGEDWQQEFRQVPNLEAFTPWGP